MAAVKLGHNTGITYTVYLRLRMGEIRYTHTTEDLIPDEEKATSYFNFQTPKNSSNSLSVHTTRLKMQYKKEECKRITS
jgi:hypothetical protein